MERCLRTLFATRDISQVGLVAHQAYGNMEEWLVWATSVTGM